MLHPFHEEVSVLESTYSGWLLQGTVIGLCISRKVAKNGDSFDSRKIVIPSSGMLHSRVPRVPTDLEPPLCFSWVGLLKESGGLVAAHQHVTKTCNFASHSALAFILRSFPK